MNYLIKVFIILTMVGCGSGDSIDGDNLFEEEKYKEAIKAYSSYLETHSNHVKSLYNRGRAYEEIGSLANATKDFEYIIKLNPKNISAYLGLAKISYNESDYSKVLIYTRKALDLNENSSTAHFFSGRAKHQLGYLNQALYSYNKTLLINKDYGEAYLYRGAVKVGKGQIKAACKDFKFAQSLHVTQAIKAVKNYCN